MRAAENLKPKPHSPEELESLIGLVRAVPDFPKMTREEQDDLLERLQDMECFAQALSLIEWRIKKTASSSDYLLNDYCLLMHILYNGLENFDRFCEVAEECVRSLKLNFSTIRLHISDEILGPNNYVEQALLYKYLAGAMADPGQQVLLLCRLALISEKKLFREAEVEPIYRSVISLEPLNIKALRFYRSWYGQGEEWNQAAKQLQNLIKAYRNPHEKQRAAHELAQIYLYNLNLPEKARQTLLTHCSESHLDTRQTLIEALERLDETEELIACLDDMKDRASNSADLAAILLKKGQTLINIGDFKEAELALRSSIEVEQSNLTAHEALISALIAQSKPKQLRLALESMAAQAESSTSRQILLDLAVSIHELYGGFVPEAADAGAAVAP